MNIKVLPFDLERITFVSIILFIELESRKPIADIPVESSGGP